MTDEFDSGILEELTKATKLLTQVSKNISKIMKDMNSRTEESVKKTNKAYDEAYNKADKQNKKNEESTEKQAKMSKTQSDREIVNTMKHLQQKNRIELSHAHLLERQFLRTASRQHGNVMGFMQMIGRQSSMIGGASELSGLEQLKKSGRVFNKDENIAYNRLTKEGAGESPLMPLFTMFDKYFGTGSTWDKFFQGHGKLAAGVIGGGAAGLGATAVMKGVQMAIEASPMLQQMLKLWKFGIMMVLRPIGDFFGFVMRPIMVMMLRKFIIPWYTKMYPIMMQLGTDLGDLVAKILGGDANVRTNRPNRGEGSALEDVITPEIDYTGKDVVVTLDNFTFALENSIEELLGFRIDLGNLFKIIPPLGYAEVGGDVKTDLINIYTDKALFDESNDPNAILIESAESMKKRWEELNPTLVDLNANLEANKNKVYEVTDTFDDLTEWAQGLIEKSKTVDVPERDMSDAEKAIRAKMEATNEKNKKHAEGNAGMFTKVEETMTYAEKQEVINNSYSSMNTGGDNVRGKTGGIGLEDRNGDGKIDWMDYMASGGIIDEPILGRGLRTGKGYMMGEAGKEAVIPLNKMGKGGSNITINIQNMSASQQDLNALRSTILSVVQEANTRRGRI